MRTLNKLQLGETGYVTSWSVFTDLQGTWIANDEEVFSKPDGTVDTEIVRDPMGILARKPANLHSGETWPQKNVKTPMKQYLRVKTE